MKKFFFWCFIFVIFIISQVPRIYLDSSILNWWDTAQHSLAFAVLFIVGLIAYPKKFYVLLLGLVCFGALIEVTQWCTGWRQADIFDWVADITGLFLLALVRFILHRAQIYFEAKSFFK